MHQLKSFQYFHRPPRLFEFFGINPQNGGDVGRLPGKVNTSFKNGFEGFELFLCRLLHNAGFKMEYHSPGFVRPTRAKCSRMGHWLAVLAQSRLRGNGRKFCRTLG